MGQVPARRSSLARRLSMSVNVSARQLQDASIVEDVESAPAETGLDPGCLILELTETALVELGCHHGQGFLLGRPAPAEELTAALRTVDADAVTVAARLARLH